MTRPSQSPGNRAARALGAIAELPVVQWFVADSARMPLLATARGERPTDDDGPPHHFEDGALGARPFLPWSGCHVHLPEPVVRARWLDAQVLRDRRQGDASPIGYTKNPTHPGLGPSSPRTRSTASSLSTPGSRFDIADDSASTRRRTFQLETSHCRRCVRSNT